MKGNKLILLLSTILLSSNLYSNELKKSVMVGIQSVNTDFLSHRGISFGYSLEKGIKGLSYRTDFNYGNNEYTTNFDMEFLVGTRVYDRVMVYGLIGYKYENWEFMDTDGFGGGVLTSYRYDKHYFIEAKYTNYESSSSDKSIKSFRENNLLFSLKYQF